MLLNKEMDAMFLTEPQATKARLYQNPVLMDTRDRDMQFGVFAFRSNSLKDVKRQKQLKLFVKAYNMACDSINKNGVKHYGYLVKKYCGIDDKTVNALPKLHFAYASSPRRKASWSCRRMGWHASANSSTPWPSSSTLTASA